METVQTLFSLFFNMSLTAAIVILFVLFVRLLLRRTPKIFSYLLWLVVLLRLLCPVSFSSALSVFQFVETSADGQGKAYVTQEPPYVVPESVQINIQKMPQVTHQPTGQTESAVRKTWDFWTAGGFVWLAGAVLLWIYSMASVFRLKRQLAAAVREKDNIYLCDYIRTAFVMGILRPRIYLPTTLGETERQYVLLHEQTHIRRGDHIFRLLAFLALSLHWFNPLVWWAFFLSGRDMEMSCDEAVMRKMGTDLCAAYSETLLNMSGGKRIFAGTPLGFGEGDVKCRIKNIMHYKKAALFVTIPVLAVVVLVSVACASNPAKTKKEVSEKQSVGYYSYPDTADMRAEAIIDACRIPETELNAMSSEQLAQAVADYPMLWDVELSSSVEYDVEWLKEQSDAYRELLGRKDAKEALLEKVRELEKSPDNAITVELLKKIILHERTFQNVLTESEKEYLNKICEYETSADLTHDGKDDIIKVSVKSTIDVWISVYDDGKKIFEEENPIHDVLGSWYGIVRRDDGAYLMRYAALCGHSAIESSYEVFSLDGSGEKVELDSEYICCDDYDLKTIQVDEWYDYADKENTYFENAVLLVNTLYGELECMDMEHPQTYRENFSWMIFNPPAGYNPEEASMEENLEYHIITTIEEYDDLRE